MRPLRAWLIRLGGFFGPRGREFDAELESHLQLHIDDGVRAGLTPQEARRQALIKLGGIEPTRQIHAERRGIRWMEHLAHDVRLGVRSLRYGAMWTAVLMLGLAIGLSTAMFAVVNALFLNPVPFPHADRLVQITLANPNGTAATRWPVVEAWRRSGRFEAVESLVFGSALIGADTGPVAAQIAFITPDLFDLLGVRPIRGRAFTDADTAGGTGGVIISADLWQRAFNSDPAIVGRMLPVDRGMQPVVGVMPKGFRFPRWDVEVWRPIDAGVRARNTWPVTYARLSPSIPSADLAKVAADIAHQADAETAPFWFDTYELSGWTNDRYAGRAVQLLAGAVALVFLTLCVNASGMLLARFNARRRQFALCAALGASRRRLLAQALVESVVLGIAGACLGVVLAAQLVAATRGLLPATLLERSLQPVEVNVTVLMAAVGMAALSMLLAGLVPAWVATRLDPNASLRLVERGGTETRGARVLARAFIVGEIALACTLLVGTALVVRSLVNLASIDRGFDSRGITIARVTVDSVLVPDRDARRAMLEQTGQALKGLPGVTAFAWSAGAPTVESGFQLGDWQSDVPGASPVFLKMNMMYTTGEFFRLYGIDVLRGRAVEATDPPTTVVVDERIASALWPGLDPVGRSFTTGTRRLDVIGVARPIHRLVMDRERDRPAIYYAFGAGSLSAATANLRCTASCPSDGIIRRRVMSVSPAVGVASVKDIHQAYEDDLSQPRLTAAISVIFAGVALLAAAGGLFSVLSYAVGRRMREFGIRAALGASAGSIGSLVFREGALVAALGLAIGSAGAWMLARSLQSVQFGVTSSDPLSWVTVVAVLGVTTLAAAWRPVRAAMRVDPVLLLKEE